MAASKRKGKPTAAARNPLWGPASINLALSLGLIVLCIVAAVVAWRRLGVGETARNGRLLKIDDIHMPAQPAWIKADIKREAFRDGKLGELSLLDRELASQVFRAFELHPWVGKVQRTSKSPQGQVIIELRYRQPVAWVEIPSSLSPEKKQGVLPVDEEAVLLPPGDFVNPQPGSFLHISVQDLSAWGPVGTVWPDKRVLGAAQLAALISGHWPQLQLERIRVSAAAMADTITLVPHFELHTRDGHRLIWGSAPGSEAVGEATTTEKIQTLRQLAEQMATTRPNSPQEFDLRLGPRGAAARTAQRP